MIVKVIATICKLSDPMNCHDALVTDSNMADISMQSCMMGAPQLADWMKQHPAERLAGWKCQIGSRGEKA